MTVAQLIRLVPDDDLEQMIAEFIEDCRAANLSTDTIRFYESNLKRYHWWCVQHHVSLDPTRHVKRDITQFIRYVQTAAVRWGNAGNAGANRPASDRTVDAYYRALKRFYNWLVIEEYIERSPLAIVRKPKLRKDQPEPFSREELERLVSHLRAAGDGFLAERNRAMTALLLDQGIRASELARIQIGQLNITSGELYIYSGKGDKPRRLHIGVRARKQIRRYWMRQRRHVSDDGAYFLSLEGEQLTGRGVHQIVTRIGERAGVHPCYPHRFRHTMAITAIRAGMGLLQLQSILGHTSLEMVRVYAKIAEEDVKQASRDHSPLDHLKLGF